ncbi:MAG: DHH family phosphoesterase [Candidatus Parcubacteria bacterium]|nr:DHH family phosphoesterase [Candidatus Parcubacteria bacterium]
MEKKFKNLDKVINRVLTAIANKEKIILYGDSDPDGVSSVIIFKEAIEALGGKINAFFFPDREKEGYGINKTALNILKSKAPALFIVFDCGLGNIEEVDMAKKMGFEVIIIDHHEPLPKKPNASLIINPKQKGDLYPFKTFACAGVVYKIAKALLSSAGKKHKLESFLELVAIATISDQMPIEADNKKLINDGLLSLNLTERPALKALIKLTKYTGNGIDEIRQKIVPPLNASNAKDHLNDAFIFLIEKNKGKAEKLARLLMKKQEIRKKEIKRINEETEFKIASSEESIIFEGDKSWPLVLLGPVGSKVCQKHNKPVFLYRHLKKESPGAVRTPIGCDGVKAMVSCRKYLGIYGGHPKAAGFRLKNENLKDFKKCLIKYFKNN